MYFRLTLKTAQSVWQSLYRRQMSQSTSCISQRSIKEGKSVADQTTWSILSDCQYRSHSYIFSHGSCIPIRSCSLQCAKDYMQCILCTTQLTASAEIMTAEKAPAGPQMDNVDSFLHMEPWSAEEVSAGAKTHKIEVHSGPKSCLNLYWPF